MVDAGGLVDGLVGRRCGSDLACGGMDLEVEQGLVKSWILERDRGGGRTSGHSGFVMKNVDADSEVVDEVGGQD